MNIRHMLSPLTTFGLFAALCGTLALASSTETSALYSSRRCNVVEVVAHRGTTVGGRTENTMRAFTGAVSLGARTLETDMQYTKDGQWVLMHDSTVTRTTSGADGRSVASLTYAQVKALRTNDGVVGGVPSVQQLVNYAKIHPSIKLQLEIKYSVPAPERLKELLAMLNAAGLKNRVILTSFSGTALNRVRTIDPTWNTALITNVRTTTAVARKYGRSVMTKESSITESYVASMHRAGVRVYAWTPDTKSTWTMAVRRGADGVITNRVGLVREYCAAARS